MRHLPACRLVLFVAAVVAPSARADDGVEFFEKKVRPILVQNCYACHSAAAKKVKGELLLDTKDGLRKGGASGPAVVPGDPNKSLLIQAVRHDKGVEKMPPEKKLSAAEVADLEAWVKMGAPDPRTATTTNNKRLDPERARELWAFRPVAEPAVPPGPSPVDACINAKLAEKGLTPAPPADKRTLLRRATYDLTGLPPTPAEVNDFLADDSPAAFGKVIDRLLTSPAYGERWGRHWLDVVRYADTAGDNSDYPVPQLVKYRDWVIGAFNRDLPYDQFVRQQLAGDLLPHADEADRHAKQIATGYLANSRRYGSYEDERYPWYLTYEDSIDNLGRTFLGLTIGCARCHDHKFDPLSQADYYALYGFFASTRYPWPGAELDKVQRDLVALAPAEQVAVFEKERRDKFAAFDATIKKLEAHRKATDEELTAAAKLTDEAEKKDRVGELNKRMESFKAQIKKVRDEREAYGKKPLPFDTAYAVAEGKTEGKKKVGNACIQVKGDPERLGPEVPRRFPTALGGQTLAATVKGSGRLELANWIADAQNPLTARVMVNRLWHHHFGKGLVRTPGNFGVLGQLPTHPELLDYLAGRFVKSGWSVKAMHRLMMNSDAYQRASTDHTENASKDVNNELLWRFDRRRLEAEAIRDSLLLVSGTLTRGPGGPHPFPAMPTWNFTQHNPFKAVYDHDRRSVYLMTQRIQRHPFLALFDGPDANAGTSSRQTSTSPLQALYLMNDPFVHGQAKAFAARLLATNSDESERVRRAYEMLYGRPPAVAEMIAATEYLAKAKAKLGADTAKAWESLSRALFLSNEFVYLD